MQDIRLKRLVAESQAPQLQSHAAVVRNYVNVHIYINAIKKIQSLCIYVNTYKHMIEHAGNVSKYICVICISLASF